MAVAAGADEIDIVLALHEFLNGNYGAARKEIRSMCAAVRAAGELAGRSIVFKSFLRRACGISGKDSRGFFHGYGRGR
jgi:deoxyribose-phosphate aldolase